MLTHISIISFNIIPNLNQELTEHPQTDQILKVFSFHQRLEQHLSRNMAAQGMPRLAQMPVIVGDYVNSGISINYVPKWGLKEALRELIQNAVDGMTSFLYDNNGTKEDWKVSIVEDDHDGVKYRSYIFSWPAQNVQIGKISYNPQTQQLILENPGTINKFNLLLGGSGADKRQKKYLLLCLHLVFIVV